MGLGWPWVHVGVALFLAVIEPGLESQLCVSIVNSELQFLYLYIRGKPEYQTHWVIVKIKMILVHIDLLCLISGTECLVIIHSCYYACPRSPQRKMSSTS